VEIKSDEEGEEKDEKKDEKKGEGDDGNVEIDFDGIVNRIIDLPIGAGNYWNIYPIGNKIYYSYFKSGGNGAETKIYDLKKKKETSLGNLGSFVITADRKKALVSQKGKWAVIDLPGSKPKIDKFIDLSDVKMWVDLRAEWNLQGGMAPDARFFLCSEYAWK